MVSEDGVAVEDCRAALQKLLSSELLSGSRRLGDFCTYSAEAALDGRTELNQFEIAEKVLGRASDFNPWDDAAVRKLATQIRHKLEEYYAGPGASDTVVISLPRRSYVLRFRRREEEAAAALPPGEHAIVEPEVAREAQPPSAESSAVQLNPLRRVWPWIVLGVVLGVVPVLAWTALRHAPDQFGTVAASGSSPRIYIQTQRGDLRGKEFDVARNAVRLGPVLGEGEEAMVRLRFTPRFSTQQAGLMALYDSDNFVRIGPHFKNRTLMEFGFEQEGVYEGPRSTYAFDPLGQLGQRRWLALRRSGANYTGYLSSDGFTWTTFGNELTLPDTSGDLHTAVYAFNGRSVNPSETAEFDHFGTGLAFHNRPDGTFQASQFPGWNVRQDCAKPVSATVNGGLLNVAFPADAIGCEWELTRPPLPGNWSLSMLVDFEAVSGSAVGIAIRGSKSRTSITRRDLDGRSIELEQKNDRDTRIPDFPGNPPVLLRLEKSGDIVHAAVSRDLETFVRLPSEVALSDLGQIESIGVVTSIAHWTTQENRPPAHIYWVRVEPLNPGSLTGRNVP